jgi:hypothetical protein
VDRIAVEVVFNAATAATPQQNAKGVTANTVGGEYVLDASKEQVLVLRAVPAQHAEVNLQLTNRLTDSPTFLSDPPEAHGVDAALDARFSERADSSDPMPSDGSVALPEGPSVIVAAHGVKGGRTVRFDLGLDAFGAPISGGIDLQANELTSLTFEVQAEALFTNQFGLTFAEFDAADRDRDGVISPHEVRLYDVPACKGCTDEQAAEKSADASQNALSVVLETRTDRLFVVK